MSDMRSQVLEAAAALFAEGGYEGVSMRDIAKTVGVTQANLYYHFQGKADLIEATLAHVFGASAEQLDAWLVDHPDDQLRAFVRWLVQALMTDRIFARLLYRELVDGDEARIASLSRTVLQKPFKPLVAAVSRGRTIEEARAVALTIIGCAIGQVLVLPLAPGLVERDQGPETVDAVVERLFGLIQSSSAEI
jgi:AcrR family transcriptional regulator